MFEGSSNISTALSDNILLVAHIAEKYSLPTYRHCVESAPIHLKPYPEQREDTLADTN